MKNFLLLLMAFTITLSVAANSQTGVAAPIIGFSPNIIATAPGNSFDVDLTITGLGNMAPDSLGVWDVDVLYDPMIISPDAAAFGDPILGNQLDLWGFGDIQSSMPDTGSWNLFQLSFDLPVDLDTMQAGSFTLATLTFDALGLGTSSLSLGVNALGDAWGDSLQFEITTATVSSVPEPTTMLLLGTGLAGIAGVVRRRKKNQA